AATGRTSGTVRYRGHQHVLTTRKQVNLAVIRVLAGSLQLFVRRSNHGGGNVSPASVRHTEAQPSGVVGFCSGTCSSTFERETALRELDNQMKRSRNRSSFSFRGLRTAISSRISKFAPSTPTAKNDKAFASSPT